MNRSIVLFRLDLRIQDNPAFNAAVNDQILPIYIHDTKSLGDWPLGHNSQQWLDNALSSLNETLNNQLVILEGDTLSIVKTLCEEHQIQNVYWNRCYEPSRIAADKTLKASLKDLGIHAESFNASLLWEPWTILNQQQEPYKVYTPYYRKGCLNSTPPRAVEAIQVEQLEWIDFPQEKSSPKPIAQWDVSEQGAMNVFLNFVAEGLSGYKKQRDFPARPHTSRLSPYLHWGMISPNQIWHHVKGLTGMVPDEDIDHFLSELGWREFSYYQLYHYPSLPTDNWQKTFDRFEWEESPEQLEAWQMGKTGIPIIDAAMRELLNTGYMHNRMRMVVASFLTKNLLIHWHEGEHWFWEHLYDADLASNSASWQWVAGSGFDAAPYFRIFNSLLQSQKFDPEGDYIRQHVPELAQLPTKHLHAPWEAPEAILKEAGIHLGSTYPYPIVDLKTSRKEALERYSQMKDAS
ncbi:cryptochrome/photolyase family protein [Candidatus Synchoanobacter obligatus]|uniref:DNA photolyase family protein n=1 Tax=Candidatus Synchoanobacter obligatus TaxID=2919597 RepID=A0ABT1L3Z0_9GAMM|nr:deoxyribodipyrimidine photo-lyase [Candidatus Synchoanobacter obligatus]MCP8351844.1 DNA photolyase family protein [Candidatus Synchoanobacter obligatus]